MDMFRYVYSIRNVELTLDKNYTMEDGTCRYLTIDCDYRGRRFPVMSMGLELDADMIQLFYQHKDKAKVKLDIYEQKLGEGDAVIDTKLYLRYTFDVIPAKDQTAYITTPDTVTKENVDVMRTLQLFEMFLIDMEMVNKFNKDMSFILQDATKASILQTFFEARDIPPRTVIATPPMLDTRYPNISIPLGTLIDNVDTMNRGYGLYDYDILVFYDYKNVYCLNFLKPNVVIDSPTEFGNVSFILLNQSNPEHNVTGSNDDMETRTHYINLQDVPVIINIGDKSTSTEFSTVIAIDSEGSVDKQTVDGDVTKATYIRAHNELTAQQLINTKLDNRYVIITTTSCGLSFLKPWKAYSFDLDTNYNDLDIGHSVFRLAALTVTFTRDNMERYLHSVELRLLES